MGHYHKKLYAHGFYVCSKGLYMPPLHSNAVGQRMKIARKVRKRAKLFLDDRMMHKRTLLYYYFVADDNWICTLRNKGCWSFLWRLGMYNKATQKINKISLSPIMIRTPVIAIIIIIIKMTIWLYSFADCRGFAWSQAWV